MTETTPRALTIAGSDSGGGAGIQADLKTFAAFGVYGASAITAVTAQNTLGVRGVEVLPAEFVREQIEAVWEDIGFDAAKTGMLATADIVEVVADFAEATAFDRLVVDPVMVAKGGDRLLDPEAVEAVRDRLVPVAACITPNLPEASALVGHEVTDRVTMEKAARELCRMGAAAALVKGGHLEREPVDVLCRGDEVVAISGRRIDTRHDHGTGCTLSAGIAAGLALGWPLERAVRTAKRYLERALAAAPRLGAGHGPVNHLVERDLGLE